MQVEEKAHIPVTICFPDYAFNESIHNMYCFHEWDVSLIHLFMIDTKIKKKSLLSFEKICYVACIINRAGLHVPACMPACTSAIVQVSLSRFHLKAKFNKMIINFIMAAIVD